MAGYNGKAIYNPSGKAGEYSYWACNIYVGCSNDCEYCYCKKGILAGAMGQKKPQLKKCFRDFDHAIEVFKKELKANLTELQKHGLFFSFTTDPMLSETIRMTRQAVSICSDFSIPVKILTKMADIVDHWLSWADFIDLDKSMVAMGYTLTGHDELEPKASPNNERIIAMKKLHDAGFKTFASIEPLIDINSAYDIIKKTRGICDLYKIGLLSGDQQFKDRNGQDSLYNAVKQWSALIRDSKVYFKDSLLKQAGINRSDLSSNCVNRDYNIFTDDN